MATRAISVTVEDRPGMLFKTTQVLTENAADIRYVDILHRSAQTEIFFECELPSAVEPVIERLRTEKIFTPVLILSAKRSVDDRVKGLQTGGDDYLTKPFSFSELLARVQALIRRSSREPEPTRLEAGGLSMDLLTREVKRGETKLDLQPREFRLLEYLMRNPGRVVSKTMIIEHVWGYDFDPLTNIVDVLVSRLRHKVDRDFEKKLIQTHRGVGYALKIF